MTRGDDVAELQARLGRLGFDAGPVDGIFGPLTAVALADFQRNSGLHPDGICGFETLQALRRVGEPHRRHAGRRRARARGAAPRQPRAWPTSASWSASSTDRRSCAGPSPRRFGSPAPRSCRSTSPTARSRPGPPTASVPTSTSG